jgi:nucleoid-associated protein YgaU
MSKDKEAAAPAVDPNTLKSNEIARTVIGAGIKPDDFRVDFRNGTATVRGSLKSEGDRQKILSTIRGVNGVTSVTDSLTVGGGASTGGLSTSGSASGARTYTVKSGDTLSKIAKAHYGDASTYNKIFDANRNILNDPDKIQPGQVLTIPE